MRANRSWLEPVMKVVVGPSEEFQGATSSQHQQRRGMIIGSATNHGFSVVDAEVPLKEMFGYSNDLRSGTQGKGEFSMEFAKYAPVPRNVQDEPDQGVPGEAQERLRPPRSLRTSGRVVSTRPLVVLRS